ncbi:MAG TPA: VOC family protein [Tepidisphaeraceae bacterium]|nr:VOC family protein [Tepidisphaeraceae bacterium]
MPEVRYLEIPVTDMDRAVAFYEAVFDIRLERVTVDGYAMAHFPSSRERVGANVTLAQGDVYVPSKHGAIVYFHLIDIDRVMSRATARGAAVLFAKKEVTPGTWVAEFEDSEGNRIALSQRDE